MPKKSEEAAAKKPHVPPSTSKKPRKKTVTNHAEKVVREGKTAKKTIPIKHAAAVAKKLQKKKKLILPLAPIERLVKSRLAELHKEHDPSDDNMPRLTEDSGKVFRLCTEDYVAKMGRRLNLLAAHGKRTKVRAEDALLLMKLFPETKAQVAFEAPPKKEPEAGEDAQMAEEAAPAPPAPVSAEAEAEPEHEATKQ